MFRVNQPNLKRRNAAFKACPKAYEGTPRVRLVQSKKAYNFQHENAWLLTVLFSWPFISAFVRQVRFFAVWAFLHPRFMICGKKCFVCRFGKLFDWLFTMEKLKLGEVRLKKHGRLFRCQCAEKPVRWQNPYADKTRTPTKLVCRQKNAVLRF